MRNAGLDEAQAGIMIARRNINNLRYADDTTLTAESEEELKTLLMKVKEESENAGLKLNIQKTKIMASGLITSWQIDGETVETVVVFQSLSRVWLFATPGLQHAMIPWSLLNLMSIESVMPFNHAVHGGRRVRQNWATEQRQSWGHRDSVPPGEALWMNWATVSKEGNPAEDSEAYD